MRSNWNNPFQDSQLSATVQFQIDQNGRAYGIKIIDSSGNDVFDRQLTLAIQKSRFQLPSDAKLRKAILSEPIKANFQ